MWKICLYLSIVSVVDKSEKYQIKVESTPDKDIKKAIGEVMSGDFLGGLKNLLSVALKVSATLQDRPRADLCSVSCFYKNPYKPYIF